jgi:general secretion pathway protein A
LLAPEVLPQEPPAPEPITSEPIASEPPTLASLAQELLAHEPSAPEPITLEPPAIAESLALDPPPADRPTLEKALAPEAQPIVESESVAPEPPPAVADEPIATPDGAAVLLDAPRDVSVPMVLTPPLLISIPSGDPFSYFGLDADPFSHSPDPHFFYPSRQHREALSILFYQIRIHAGFLALLGTPGTGKSILLQSLTDLLEQHSTQFTYLINPKITASELFELLAHDFQLQRSRIGKSATLIALNEYLVQRARAGATTALVVDNAEKLSVGILEEIELLGNLENRQGKLLQVVFAAQPSFEEKLDAPELRGLKQRFMLRARLSPFDAAQTAAYMQHRLSRAGARSAIFPDDVIAEIHRRSHGVPRLINALCGQLLATCMMQGVRTVSKEQLDKLEDDFEAELVQESW